MGNIEQRITVVKIARRARASTTAWPREEKREWVAVVNSTEASLAGEVTSVVAVVAVKSGKEKKEYGVAQRERSRIASDWYSLWCVCVCRGSRIAGGKAIALYGGGADEFGFGESLFFLLSFTEGHCDFWY